MRELLLQKGADIQERDFFKEPFTEAELRQLSASVGIGQMLAVRSPSFKKLGLDERELSESEILNLMLREPRLVRRPMVKVGDQLVVGGNLSAVEAALSGAV